ncbi:MAG: 50S ribosomal protein L10 [Phycisphaerales bacterium]|nr:50S ribosomal protein L10 [Phycisphaerales bacterium]
MSKSVKDMIKRDYRTKFAGEGGPSEALVISIRGVKGTDTTRLRMGLAKKNIKITVVRNSLAKGVMEGSPLAPLADMLEGSSALAYGGESVVEVAREIVANLTKTPGLELKGAILDGQVFKGKAGVTELSKFPTKDEAIGQVVTLVVSPARKLVGAIQGPGSMLAGILKAIEGKLEKGEAIAK